MLESGGGTMVIMSSLSADRAFALESIYCVCKAATQALARCIAIEYRTKGIRANALCPGFVNAHVILEGKIGPKGSRQDVEVVFPRS